MRPAISSRGGQRRLRKSSLKLNLNFIQIERIAKIVIQNCGIEDFAAKGGFGVLSIQKKFQFETLDIPHTQWHGTFRLHRPDPSHCAFGYCSCNQDIKERYWGQQFCRMERDISVRPK